VSDTEVAMAMTTAATRNEGMNILTILAQKPGSETLIDQSQGHIRPAP
jgi:hypothetical protein